MPANTVLTITSAGYRYREEAQDSCSFEGKILCSLEQLEAAKSAGPIPLIDWGWFGIEGRAAQIQDCLPGNYNQNRDSSSGLGLKIDPGT